jgi:hypothetical protein
MINIAEIERRQLLAFQLFYLELKTQLKDLEEKLENLKKVLEINEPKT